MALKDITITGSIGSKPSQSYGQKTYVSSTDQESFPVEQVTGSDGGAIPNFNGKYSTTDLFVNITQSWAGVNDTPAGLVPYIHNTQEEFIDGEYSGSVLLVSNGSLTDKNCEQFLTVNTVEMDYKPFFYFTTDDVFPFPNEMPLSNFLDSNTAPNDGEIYLSRWREAFTLHPIIGIIYAKVARKDVQGNDNTLSLQELTDLRFKFSDVSSVVDYHVLTITEYPTYYLYSIKLNNITSADNNILNYYVSASYTGSNVSLSTGRNGITGSSGYTNVLGNSLGYFNQTYGNNLFGSTPNISLTITASVQITPSPESTRLFLHNGSIGLDIASSSVLTGAGTLTLHANVTPIEGDNYWLEINSSTGASFYYNVQWLITQSTSPHSSTNLTVLEPYLTNNFNNSDCDILINNASTNHYSEFFREVLYENGGTIPSNYQQIMSGTAEFAPINDYNYASRAQTLPRYEGVRTLQQNENVWTSGDIGYGQTPSVQNLETYFAYFDFIESTNYELIGKKQVHILYLIDKDGNTLTPTLSAPYYPNLLQNFESDGKINVVFSTNIGNITNTQGYHQIIRTGLSPKPVIWSQSGSTANMSTTMSFENPNGLTVLDYGTTIKFGSVHSPTGQYINIISNAASPIEIQGSQYTTSSIHPTPTQSYIGIQTSSNTTNGILTINLNGVSTYVPVHQYELYLQQSIDGGSTWTTLNTLIDYLEPGTLDIQLSSSPITLISGSQFRAAFYYPYEFDINNGIFSLLNTVPPTHIDVYAPYWTTGSLPNTLTGSAFTFPTSSYNTASPYVQTFPITSGSGYSENLRFTIQPLDQIRFEANEATSVYTILQVSGSGVSGSLFLTLDRNITPGTNLDSFLIRRYVPNPSYIVIDALGNTSGSGFLFPEYTSLDIQNNFDTIIQTLKTKGLIPV